METIGLGSDPPQEEVGTDISEKNNFCKVCWQKKGEYKCIGGMICPSCLDKLPYEMRGDIADILIYDAIRAAKKYGNQTQSAQAQAGKTQNTAPVTQANVDSANSIAEASPNSTTPGELTNTGNLDSKPQVAPVSPGMAPPVKGRPKKGLIIGGAVLGILAVTAIAVIIFMNMGKSGDGSLSSGEIVEQLQSFGFPIIDIVTYDEDSDPEGLLGVDGEYTSKTSFTDSRGSQSLSCSIEVFANADDATTRSLYLQSSSASSFYAPAVYAFDNIIMILDGGLSPSDLSAYEDALAAVINGEDYTGPTHEDSLDSGYSDNYHGDGNGVNGGDTNNDSNGINEGNINNDSSDINGNSDSSSGGSLDSIAPSPLQ